MNLPRSILALSAIIFMMAQSAVAQTFIPETRNISVKEYIKESGGVARYVAPGKLRLAGKRVLCGKRPSVIDSEFDTWAGAYVNPGFIIINPVYMNQEPAVVQHYIYAHECGHQFRGFDEDTADAFAIRRGVRQGWLRGRGMRQICKFISQVPGDAEHPPGTVRCKRMKRVYADILKRHKRHVAKKRKARYKNATTIGRRKN